MFAVLTRKSTGKRSIRRAHGVGAVEERRLPHGRFYTVELLDSDKGVRWDDARLLLGKCKKRLVVQDSLTLPDDGELELVDAKGLVSMLLVNTASLILSQLFLEGFALPCCLFDRRGEALDRLEALSRFACEMCVVTEDARYPYRAAELYRRSGVPITVCRSARPPLGAVTVDLDGGCGDEYALSADCASPCGVENTQSLLSVCPEHTDAMRFLAAAYLYCSEESLAERACSLLSFRGRQLSPFAFKELLRARAVNAAENGAVFRV